MLDLLRVHLNAGSLSMALARHLEPIDLFRVTTRRRLFEALVSRVLDVFSLVFQGLTKLGLP